VQSWLSLSFATLCALFCQAEINQHWPPALSGLRAVVTALLQVLFALFFLHHDVVWFDVSVDDVAVVQVRHCRQDPVRDFHLGPPIEGIPVGESVVEGLAPVQGQRHAQSVAMLLGIASFAAFNIVIQIWIRPVRLNVNQGGYVRVGVLSSQQPQAGYFSQRPQLNGRRRRASARILVIVFLAFVIISPEDLECHLLAVVIIRAHHCTVRSGSEP
jgi:hypothetical protein